MKIDYESIKNNKDYFKPNEDLFFVDEHNKLFMVLDGVSRDIVNGNYPKPSPAAQVTKIMADTVHEYLIDNYKQLQVNTTLVLQEAIKMGNLAVESFNKKLNHSFLAGTVAVLVYVQQKRLFYCYIGDCVAAIIRHKNFLSFTKQQTKLIRLHKSKFTKEQIRNDICNNSRHKYCYGVLNGQESALQLLKFGHIDLQDNDTIILATDGLEKILNSNYITQLQSLSCRELIHLVTELEEKYNFTDDKTIIKIKF